MPNLGGGAEAAVAKGGTDVGHALELALFTVMPDTDRHRGLPAAPPNAETTVVGSFLTVRSTMSMIGNERRGDGAIGASPSSAPS
ncbi:MAG: hypothetical protein HY825_16070 [Acidobacteria bacterium]|nr:hypothetical protein [Acidobacteriota bacterium]